MSEPELVVRRPRPATLSDPYSDFTPESLRALLAKPDDRLDGVDFRLLFGPALPAGTYDEVVYFLPLALGYLRRATDDVFEALPAVVEWMDGHAEKLAADGLLDPVRATLRSWLAELVRDFVVVHHDEAACRAKGWRRLAYHDEVPRSGLAVSLAAELARTRAFADVAEAFVGGLARHGGDPVKAAWFLEIASAPARSSFVRPPRRSPVSWLIKDRDLLEEAGRVVREKVVPHEPSPTYWLHTFAYLGLSMS